MTQRAAQAVVLRLRSQFGEGEIAWLPTPSYHVTLFDGVVDARREAPDWPLGLPSDATLDECHALMEKRLRGFDLGFAPPIRFVASEGTTFSNLTAVPLTPVDSEEERRLRDLRDRLSVATGIRHKGHETYGFHMSFGYYVRAFSASRLLDYDEALIEAVREFRSQVGVVELGAPEYCLFDDMTAFRTQFHLERRK